MTKRQRIERHYNALVERYGRCKYNAFQLYRSLRRWEVRLNRWSEKQACEELSPRMEREVERLFDRAAEYIPTLFTNRDMLAKELKINRDPRGYALKLDGDFRNTEIECDWGGYGLLAPEF